MARKPSENAPRSTVVSSRELLDRARAGDERAVSRLFRRQAASLRRWARGRLPRWARSVTDTADIVQDVLMRSFRRLDLFEDRGKGTLQAYLRRGVENRILDEMRRVRRRPSVDLEDAADNVADEGPSQFDRVMDAEQEEKYKRTLATLTEDERLLVVGRLELGYTYEQLALITNRPTKDAARVALHRAVLKMAERLSGG
ncbi:MAG TPA: RNA polymerase sigma factor [Vicinamibacterales bacterium]